MNVYKFNVQLSKTGTLKRQEQILAAIPRIADLVELSDDPNVTVGGISIEVSGPASFTVKYRFYGTDQEPATLDADDIERIEKALMAVPWVLSVTR